jgi:hypothetical protein
VSLALTLSGPRPWRARGRASFSILFFDVSFGFDVTIDDDAPPVLPHRSTSPRTAAGGVRRRPRVERAAARRRRGAGHAARARP